MIPEYHAWNEHQPAVDEQQFTPWAEPGWLAHNGQSPEVAVCDFVRVLVRMLRPQLVIETGIGQGYMTRTIASALSGDQLLLAFESDDDWRAMLYPLQFWTDRQANVSLAFRGTLIPDDVVDADLSIIDSEFEFRFPEIRLWHEHAKPGAVAVIHDTADRDATVHQQMRRFIGDLGMTGVFLNNPRGCFLAVQPAKEKHDGHQDTR